MAILSSERRGSVFQQPARSRMFPVIAVVWWTVSCGGEADPVVAPTDIGHVHDLVVEGDTLLAATHRGLLRLDDGTFRAVGDEIHDLMALVTMPNGDLVASGHPDLRLEKYRVEGAPSFLGLARSADDGETWKVVGLLGEADFHALVGRGDGIVGGDSTGTVWWFDADGDGQPVGSIPFDINDLAVSFDNPAVIVATSWDGELAVSEDAGLTWELQPDAPAILEVEWTAAGLTGATAAGRLWTAADSTGPFELVGEVPGEVESLLVGDAGTWVATHGGQIYRQDAGGSWTPLVRTDD